MNALREAIARCRTVFSARKEKEGLTYERVAELCGGRPSASTIHCALSKHVPAHEPRWTTIEAIARALGVDLGSLDAGEPWFMPLAGTIRYLLEVTDMPVVAEPGAKVTRPEVAFAGLAAVRVADDWALPLAERDGLVIVDPAVHPDDAVPNPVYGAALAVIVVRDPKTGQRLSRVGVWRHNRSAGIGTLTPMNPQLRNDAGQVPLLVVADDDVEAAWAVVGSLAARAD